MIDAPQNQSYHSLIAKEHAVRPTTIDIAAAAGVSLATVDRVLNGRPGVRPATIERVNAAISQLKYVRDVHATNLARKRDYRAIFLLPEGSGQFLTALRTAAEDMIPVALAERTTMICSTFPHHDPHQLAMALNALDLDQVDGIAIMAPETPQVRDAIRRLKLANVAVVALVSDLPNSARDHFVGINNIAAGRTAGLLMGRFMCGKPSNIAVISSSLQQRDSIERRFGFDQVLSESFPDVTVLPTLETHDDSQAMRRVFGELMASSSGLSGIYSVGTGNQVLIGLLEQFGLAGSVVFIAHELTRSTRKALISGTADAVITQDLGHIVRSALRLLRAKSDAREIIPSQERIRIEVILRENILV